MPQYTEDLIKKAREAKSPEELVALAEENGTPITDERAAALYERVRDAGALADDELDNVAGGCNGGGRRTCQWCGGTISIYPDGDYCDSCGHRC